jgi:hypothetical protein
MRKAPIFRCNQGLGSLTGRTPITTLIRTTIVIIVADVHVGVLILLVVIAEVDVRRDGVEKPRVT